MARHRKLNPNGVHLYGQYKKRAKRKGLVFDLTKDEFLNLTQSDCYICGSKPSQKYIQSYKRTSLRENPFTYNGIDRLDSKKGYSPGLVAACCGFCNMAKKEMSLNKFLQHVRKIYNFALLPAISSSMLTISSNEGEDTNETTEARSLGTGSHQG